MREANTTFVNLRAALDDLDPLVDASKPVATRLRPFFSEPARRLGRRRADHRATSSAILKHPGPANDLIELTRLQPPLAKAAVGSGSPDCGNDPTSLDQLAKAQDDNFTQGAFGETVCALRNSEPPLSMFRAYTPELVGWFDDFGHSGYIDAIGGIGRIGTTFNPFSSPPRAASRTCSTPLTPDEQIAALDTGNLRRCPGGNERPVSDIDPSDDSVPFTDGGALTDGRPGDCDPSQTAPGP